MNDSHLMTLPRTLLCLNTDVSDDQGASFFQAGWLNQIMNYKLTILTCSISFAFNFNQTNWTKKRTYWTHVNFFWILTQGTFSHQQVIDKLRCPCTLFYNFYQHAFRFSDVSGIQEKLQKWTWLGIGHGRDWCQFGKVKDSIFFWRFKNVFFDSQSGHEKLHVSENDLPRFRPCAFKYCFKNKQECIIHD